MFDGEEGRDVGDLTMQALRSASNWSLGKRNTECSIYECYLELIDKAEHFIYIENQFFISSTSGAGVENRIVKALCVRIIRAIQENKPFKVVVFMPLMPAFEANLEDHQGKVMQIQIGLQNTTIGKGENSLIEMVRKNLDGKGINHEEYIMICSLRKFERRPSDGKPITELIYIHSKLMIVDDKRLIIGSANINDRSMLGSRDSELAVCIEGRDSQQVQSDSGPVGVVNKIHEFRKALFKEHFGFDVEFPALKKTWDELWQIAKTNTAIYSKVFRIYPSDEYSNWGALQTREKLFDAFGFDTLTPNLKGHAVLYPYLFLKEENLLEEAKNSELSLMVVPIYALF